MYEDLIEIYDKVMGYEPSWGLMRLGTLRRFGHELAYLREDVRAVIENRELADSTPVEITEHEVRVL
jgi:hypothetical protein